MALMDDVSAAIADAMRRQDRARLSALRMLKAALMNRVVEKNRDLDAGEERQVVQSLVKQRKDSIEQFRLGNRQDLVDQETAEIAILETYLPPAPDPAVVDRAIADAIAESGATSMKDVGRVMKTVMAKLAGQNIDGKAVNELVRARLRRSLTDPDGARRRSRIERTARQHSRPRSLRHSRRHRHPHQSRSRPRPGNRTRGAVRRRQRHGRVPRCVPDPNLTRDLFAKAR
jgi:uncharacterized protein YqeY